MKKIFFISIIIVSIIGVSYILFYSGILNGKSYEETRFSNNHNTNAHFQDSVYTDEIVSAKQEALLYLEEDTEEHFTFYIVTGSFSNKENANFYKSLLESKGINASIIRSDFDHYKVSIFSSKDKKEALDSLMKVRKIEEFESAWLLKRKRN